MSEYTKALKHFPGPLSAQVGLNFQSCQFANVPLHNGKDPLRQITRGGNQR